MYVLFVCINRPIVSAEMDMVLYPVWRRAKDDLTGGPQQGCGEREDDDESSSDEEDSDDGLGAEDGEDGEYDRDIDVAGRDAVL